ncbi:MAG: hypothetical protein IJO87_05630 [Eggerthellaceae bacterium]|nr:hypothetical protein [Eggerthellaceae bacterium]
MPSKKYLIAYTVVMSVIMCVVCAAIIPILSGQVLTPTTWVVGFGLTFVISVILSLVIPMGKIGGAVCGVFGTTPDAGLGRLLMDVISTTIIGGFMVAFMTGFSTGLGSLGDVNYVTRALSSVIEAWGPMFVTVVLSDAIATAICRKIA